MPDPLFETLGSNHILAFKKFQHILRTIGK